MITPLEVRSVNEDFPRLYHRTKLFHLGAAGHSRGEAWVRAVSSSGRCSMFAVAGDCSNACSCRARRLLHSSKPERDAPRLYWLYLRRWGSLLVSHLPKLYRIVIGDPTRTKELERAPLIRRWMGESMSKAVRVGLWPCRPQLRRSHWCSHVRPYPRRMS